MSWNSDPHNADRLRGCIAAIGVPHLEAVPARHCYKFARRRYLQVLDYTGLLTSDIIGQAFWDNANHLYAVSLSGRLYVFTVTAESYSEAPGSPYAIPAGGYAIPFIVQPLTPLKPAQKP